jgi:hypothetical protein
MNTGNAIVSLVVVLIILAVIFLIFREFFCWYWKINERIAILNDIKKLLQNAEMSTSIGDNKLYEPSPKNVNSDKYNQPVKKGCCPDCGTLMDTSLNFCQHCGNTKK